MNKEDPQSRDKIIKADLHLVFAVCVKLHNVFSFYVGVSDTETVTHLQKLHPQVSLRLAAAPSCCHCQMIHSVSSRHGSSSFSGSTTDTCTSFLHAAWLIVTYLSTHTQYFYTVFHTLNLTAVRCILMQQFLLLNILHNLNSKTSNFS